MAFFSFLNHLVDLLVSPFHNFGPLPQLVVLSLVSTVLLLAAFKRLSNQETIKLHKNKIFGNFLEIAIYRDQFRRSLTCQARVFKHNLLYLGAIGKPLLLLMIPMILVCLQLDYRLGYQVMKPGQSFVIEAQLDTSTGHAPDLLDGLSVTTSDSIYLETPPLRIPATGQVFWNARLTQAGTPNFISLSVPGQTEPVRKEIAVTETALNRFTPGKSKMLELGDLLTSGEERIPSSSAIKTLRVAYLGAEYPLLLWAFSPIVYYFILTIIFGLLLKPVMKVSI